MQAQPAKLPTPKNLIVFLPDQLRADVVSGTAPSGLIAPNISKLAAQSVIFERTYVTQPVCAPSRSSLLSGTWPHQNGCQNNESVLPARFLCLPEMLADKNYSSAYFGKWHLGDEFIAQHGFNEWASIVESFKLVEKKSHRLRRLEELWSFFNPKASDRMSAHTSSDYSQFLISKGFKPDGHREHYFSEKFTSDLPFEFSKPKFLEMKACDFLARHKSQPFIMFVAFFEPHSPYHGPFDNVPPRDSITLDPTAGDVLPENVPLRSRILQEFYRAKLQSSERYKETKQKYFGLIYEIDLCIGAILGKLEQLGMADRTVVTLTSDHGDMMSSYGILGKTLMYDPSATVPYVIRVPEMRPTRFSQPVSHIDFSPTMLELLGQPPHKQCVGRSRANWLRGEQDSDAVFAEWSPEKNDIDFSQSKLASPEQIETCLAESTRAVITPDGWKLCLRDKDKNELYNVRDDPEERRNLYSDSAKRDVVQRLTSEIHQWQGRTSDTIKV